MTTTVVDTAADLPAVPAAASRRAVLALARMEAVRLLRHPLTLAATLFLVGFWVAWWWTNQANHYPVLQDVDRDSELAVMLLLGSAALVVGNLAVLRAHRDGTTQLGQVLILPDTARTMAHLLAVLPLAGLGAVLILVRVGLLAVLTPAAGHPDPAELAAGPAIVLVLGALGVLLGRLTRSPVAAPLAVLALLASLVVLPLVTNASTSGGGTRWLQLAVPQGDPNLPVPAPAYLMARPSAAHLGYLLGLAGLLAVGALLRAGARGRRALVAGTVALAVMLTGAVTELVPAGRDVTAARLDAVNHASKHQTCRSLDGVTYCAFTDFTRWVPAWNTVVQSVLAEAPASARPANLALRQRLVVGSVMSTSAARDDDAAAGTPDPVPVGTRWGDSRSAATLAATVAARLVGSPSADDGNPICGGQGVLIVWLAGHSSALANTGITKLAADAGLRTSQPDVVLPLAQTNTSPGFSVPQPDYVVATEALARPAADMAARIRQSWTVLTAPGTTTQQAAQILGVPAPADATAGSRGSCR